MKPIVGFTFLMIKLKHMDGLASFTIQVYNGMICLLADTL